MNTQTISITPCTGDHPLYMVYPQQFNPQDAYVQLDCDDAEMNADWNAAVGYSIPMPVYHGRIKRYPVSPYLTSEEVNKLMEGILPLAQRVVDGYTCEWDGHNLVGKFSEDSQEASEYMERICQEAEANDGWIPDEE